MRVLLQSKLCFLPEFHYFCVQLISTCGVVIFFAEVCDFVELACDILGRHGIWVEENTLNENIVTSDLCHLSLATYPPPISKTLPFSLQVSWQRQATRGMTKLDLTVFKTYGGMTVSSILVAAMGAMVLTRMFFFWPYLAKARVKPCSASLAAEQLTCPKLPYSPEPEEVLIILPQPCSLITFQAARLHEYAPQTCTLKIRFQSSSFIFWKDTSLKIPALLIKMSILLKLSIAVLMILSPNQTESQLATATPPFAFISATTLSAVLLPLPTPVWDVPRSLTTTLAPRPAKKRAYSLPIPWPAPVTTTTLPSYLRVILSNQILMTSFPNIGNYPNTKLPKCVHLQSQNGMRRTRGQRITKKWCLMLSFGYLLLVLL